jgi:hypothetical protein
VVRTMVQPIGPRDLKNHWADRLSRDLLVIDIVSGSRTSATELIIVVCPLKMLEADHVLLALKTSD